MEEGGCAARLAEALSPRCGFTAAGALNKQEAVLLRERGRQTRTGACACVCLQWRHRQSFVAKRFTWHAGDGVVWAVAHASAYTSVVSQGRCRVWQARGRLIDPDCLNWNCRFDGMSRCKLRLRRGTAAATAATATGGAAGSGCGFRGGDSAAAVLRRAGGAAATAATASRCCCK